jgi:uncharacterized protein (TIGR02246 family)
VALSAEDRLAIEEVVYRYARACDLEGTLDDFLAIFTDDAVLAGPLTDPVEGREGIREWFAGLERFREQTRVRHVITNVLAEETEDGARAYAYLSEVLVYPTPVPGRAAATEVAVLGDYTFQLRRADGGWRIARRDWRMVA